MTTEYVLRINADNAAFDNGEAQEVARILREAADKLECDGVTLQKLRDANGNLVGLLKRNVKGLSE